MAAMRGKSVCENCYFYDEPVCRRNAPQVVWWENKSPRTPAEEIVVHSVFPKVGATDWCGEFIDK